MIGHLVEQIEATGVFVFRVIIGKERSDVTNSGGATERVNQRVADDIRVAVALQPHVPGKFDATEHEPAAYDQPVKVEPGSYAHRRPPPPSSRIYCILLYSGRRSRRLLGLFRRPSAKTL